MHQVDRFAQFAETHPMQTLRGIRQFLRRFLFQRNHRHIDALAASALEHKKRKAAIARDQSPSCCDCICHELARLRVALLRHFTIPRSEVSTNLINSATSGESLSVARISLSA